MATLADVLARLADQVRPARQVARLESAIANATVTTFTVTNSSDPVQVGETVEIDDELLEVTDATRVAGSVDTYTCVRGVNGSVAVAHADDAPIALNPTYPRFRRKRAINAVYTDWVSEKAPMVVVDSTQTFQVTSLVLPVPADAVNVLAVDYQEPGWVRFCPLRCGRPRSYPTSVVATGRGVPLAETPPAGYTAHVTYTKPWGPDLSADTDPLPASWVFGLDMLAHGAAAYLLGGKFVDRATFDKAHAQREEDKAGQAQNLTLLAGREHYQQFVALLDQQTKNWEGSKIPVYHEPAWR